MKKHWFGVILLDNFIERYLVVMEISEYAVNFLVLAGLLFYGVISSRLSTRMNMPVLLLFLAVGIYLGSFQKLDFTLYKGAAVQFANVVGTVAMAFILYSGGLETDMRSVKKIFVPGILLSTLGVFITAAVLAVGVHLLLGWTWAWSFLLGAVVSSTDAAAVFAVLRSKGVSLHGNLASALEFESGSNDPMAALLTIFMVSFLKNPEIGNLWQFAWVFPVRMIVGIICGVGIGFAGKWLFNNAKLDYEGLYFVLGIAVVIASYGVTECVFGNGFMAAYCAGLTMGNLRYNYKKGQIRFNNGLAWLMQVAMFTVLGMLVTFKDLISIPPSGLHTAVWVRGLLLGAVLMFVARPVAVFLCLIKSKFNIRERLLISWVGLRGAAPIVLATFPLAAHLSGNAERSENAVLLFNLVFCMVIVSVLIQGRTLMPFAKLLKLDCPLQEKKRMPLELEDTGTHDNIMHEFEIDKSSPCVNKSLAEINLPHEARVMLVRRGGKFEIPRGDTVIATHDGLLIIGSHDLLHKLAAEYFPGNDYFEN